MFDLDKSEVLAMSVEEVKISFKWRRLLDDDFFAELLEDDDEEEDLLLDLPELAMRATVSTAAAASSSTLPLAPVESCFLVSKAVVARSMAFL